MNLYLHSISGDDTPIKSGDSLISDPGHRYDLVITNQRRAAP
jgi:type I restriction enzyme M protein